jgi:YVTN family beta-propeller protein
VNPETDTIYAANQGGSTVSVISGQAGTVTGAIPVGSRPWGVAVNPEANTVYVTNSGESTVSVRGFCPR